MVVGRMGWGVSDQGWRKGPWTPEEDKFLTKYVSLHGGGRWSSVARSAGLNRSGKSCRLRWVNYLRPGLKRGHITPQEEAIIIELHALWGNKWSTIASYLPGRTDNEIKNYWRTNFKKKRKSSEKRDKKKFIDLKNQHEENSTGFKLSPYSDVTSDPNIHELHGQREISSMYPNMENPCLPVPYHGVESWSSTDTISMDVLWGSLWNFDDQNGKMVQQAHDNCSKMANQNHQATNFAPWPFGFDKVDMQIN